MTEDVEGIIQSVSINQVLVAILEQVGSNPHLTRQIGESLGTLHDVRQYDGLAPSLDWHEFQKHQNHSQVAPQSKKG